MDKLYLIVLHLIIFYGIYLILKKYLTTYPENKILMILGGIILVVGYGCYYYNNQKKSKEIIEEDVEQSQSNLIYY